MPEIDIGKPNEAKEAVFALGKFHNVNIVKPPTQFIDRKFASHVYTIGEKQYSPIHLLCLIDSKWPRTNAFNLVNDILQARYLSDEYKNNEVNKVLQDPYINNPKCLSCLSIINAWKIQYNNKLMSGYLEGQQQSINRFSPTSVPGAFPGMGPGFLALPHGICPPVGARPVAILLPQQIYEQPKTLQHLPHSPKNTPSVPPGFAPLPSGSGISSPKQLNPNSPEFVPATVPPQLVLQALPASGYTSPVTTPAVAQSLSPMGANKRVHFGDVTEYQANFDDTPDSLLTEKSPLNTPWGTRVTEAGKIKSLGNGTFGKTVW